jgi:hypothetical protein
MNLVVIPIRSFDFMIQEIQAILETLEKNLDSIYNLDCGFSIIFSFERRNVE